MRILLVHNTSAGDEVHTPASLVSLIEQHGHDVVYCAAEENWQSILDASIVDLVVAAGGDGTVEDVARHSVGRRVTLGVLPLGTANNVAGILGVSSTPIPDLIAGWASGRPRPFDCGLVTGPGGVFRFLESVGIGFIADAMAEIEDGDAGHVNELAIADDRMDAAIDVLRATLRRLEPMHVELVLDGRSMSGDYLLVEVMNFGSAGPRLRLVPEAHPADGLFDVVLAQECHRDQLIDELPRYRPGQWPALWLPAHQARRVTFTCPRDQRLHIDDQLHTCGGVLELTAEHHAVTFLA